MEETAPPASREILATMRDVTVTYDGYLTRALARVGLDFRRGEVTAVLGASGAGKSTVLKLLGGRLRPTEGAVTVFGRSPRGGAAKARVGYLPGKIDPNRRPGFFGRLFARKNESSSPGRGVARLTQAFLGNRDLLILDDPFEGLEPAGVAEVKALIRDMVARGKTVILSSDSLMEIKDICQRMVIIHEGKVQAMGTLDELLAAGGAIRFLPAVLPREIVERVLGVLREEIVGGTVPPEMAVSSPKTNSPTVSPGTGKGTKAGGADQLLTGLTRSAEGAPSSSADSKPDDSIDHEKLEELTKLKKPE